MEKPPMIRRPANVLLVDDEADDALLVREAFLRVQSKTTIHVYAVPNGEACLAYLRKEAPYEAAPTPDLILLDLNMPVMDGRETLAALAAETRFRILPVLVLSTSANDEDIQEMYALGCSTYIVKPLEFNEFQKVVDLICHYWFGMAALPSDLP